MADSLRPHKRQQHDIILLSLEAIHSGDLGGLAKHGVRAAGGNDVTYEVLLTVVGGDDADLVSRMPKHPGVSRSLLNNDPRR